MALNNLENIFIVNDVIAFCTKREFSENIKFVKTASAALSKHGNNMLHLDISAFVEQNRLSTVEQINDYAFLHLQKIHTLIILLIL